MSILEVSGLRKEYPSFLLDDISFSLAEGKITGFIGRNGAGKSTTLKSLLGLVHPDGGEVRFCGMDTVEQEKAFKEEIGVVLGGIDFYPKKKLKTITAVTKKFYVNWDEEAYRRYMALFALDEQKRVDQLSNGMRVKYLIVLALSHGARLLILDEPTSGLDPVSRDELVQLFKA
ncbi:MAG: ABC transporter ATP-binding protein, partial [Firmicutes bacterium]|nr:ABC transporter ATP-binding protein [Bacillota bacterium]